MRNRVSHCSSLDVDSVHQRQALSSGLSGWIKIEFRINHEPGEGKYYLYSFGKGGIRRLQPDIFDSVEEAKTAAYRIYNNEMARIKRAVDYLVAEDSY